MSAYLSAIIQANPESFKEAMLMDESVRAFILEDAHTFYPEARKIVRELAEEQGWDYVDDTTQVILSTLQKSQSAYHRLETS